MISKACPKCGGKLRDCPSMTIGMVWWVCPQFGCGFAVKVGRPWTPELCNFYRLERDYKGAFDR
jgi:hypothetical protein